MGQPSSTPTVDRILLQAQDLFNRFGVPNVSPAQLAGTLSMSTGNLYYHFPSKADIVMALFDAYTRQLKKILACSVEVKNTEDAWFFLHSFFELMGEYRFIYRDLSDLLSKNIRLEQQVHSLVQHKTRALEEMIKSLQRAGTLSFDRPLHARAVATSMTLLMTYWLNFDYIKTPRQALEAEHSAQALRLGAFHALHLLAPYLQKNEGKHWEALAQAYL